MEKKHLLDLIRAGLADGTIVPGDIERLQAGKAVARDGAHASSRITNVFYIIGAVIAVLGVLILVVQNWSQIGLVGRLLVTLGIGLPAYMGALYLEKPHQRVLAEVFFCISAALLPIGVAVLFKEAGAPFGALAQSLVALALSLLYLVAFWQTRRNLLVLIGAFGLSWSFFALIAALFPVSSTVLKWAAMILGISYLLVASYFQSWKPNTDREERREKRSVEGVLYAMGTVGILAPSLAFDGALGLLAILPIFGAFYLSVYVRSKVVLSLSALFLMAYIFRITSRYFVDSVGWPFALIVVGFCVIGVGYGTFYLSQRYIPKLQA